MQASERIKVSHHAVCRFCERILGVTLEGDFEDNAAKAVAYAQEIGTTVDELRSVIWTNGLSKVVAMGFTQYRSNVFVAAIDQPAGVVTTIMEAEKRTRPKMKVYGKSEWFRGARRHHRRYHNKKAHSQHDLEAVADAADLSNTHDRKTQL